jgi:anti-sigma factor RsiW
MTCETVRERLNDYLDGALGEAERAELVAHLEACESCGGEAQALRDLISTAAGLSREVVPGRELWPAVAAEIHSGPLVRLTARRRPRLPLLSGLASAAALVAAASGLTLLLSRGPAPGGPMPAPAAEQANLLEPEREYVRASEELRAALATRPDALPPEAQQSLEQDLQVIDKALVDVREALRQDPENAGLNRLLATTHRLKVEALRRVLRLASI